jgi:hypothetical protein
MIALRSFWSDVVGHATAAEAAQAQHALQEQSTADRGDAAASQTKAADQLKQAAADAAKIAAFRHKLAQEVLRNFPSDR